MIICKTQVAEVHTCQAVAIGNGRIGSTWWHTRKHRAGSSKKAGDPENMVQNCQGAVRAGSSLGNAGTSHGTGSQERAARGT